MVEWITDGDQSGEGLVVRRRKVGRERDVVRRVEILRRNLDGEGKRKQVIDERYNVAAALDGERAILPPSLVNSQLDKARAYLVNAPADKSLPKCRRRRERA